MKNYVVVYSTGKNEAVITMSANSIQHLISKLRFQISQNVEIKNILAA